MIKILFLDTSALLSFFISDKGTPAMRWLISSDNKMHNATRYVINNQVIREFESSLTELVNKKELKQGTADNILALFNTHYKNHKFKVTGKEASVKETVDGMYNFLGRLAKPILVTCSAKQAEENSGYKIINPCSHTHVEIELLLQGKKQSKKKVTDSTGFYQRFFRKNRMMLALKQHHFPG